METYSYSRIKRYEDCPLSYYRKYMNNEEPDMHGITEAGLFMHELLEGYEKNEKTLNELLPYFEDNFYNNIKHTTSLQMSNDYSKDMYSLYYNGFHDYLEHFEGIPDCKEILCVEYAFDEQYTDFCIQGKIDLVYKNNKDELCILDHKSKNKFKTKKEQADYARQLYTYAWAWHKVKGEYPKWLVFNMLRGEPIYIEFNEKDMQAALDWFVEMISEIRNTFIYEAKPDTFYCNNFCLLGRSELCEDV